MPHLKLASRDTKLTSATIEALGAESAEAAVAKTVSNESLVS